MDAEWNGGNQVKAFLRVCESSGRAVFIRAKTKKRLQRRNIPGGAREPASDDYASSTTVTRESTTP